MEIDENVINKIASLSQLHLNADEKEKIGKDLSKILDYVEKINELDTENVSPTAHTLSLTNVSREDETKDSMDTKDIIKLAPKHKDNFIVVPKVI